MGLFKKLSELVSGGSREGSSGHPHRILLVGLDNSGKSTIIQWLKPKKAVQPEVVPTVGFSVEEFTKNGLTFSVFDMSGQGRYRNLWEHYYRDVGGIIFVIDSTDKIRMCVAKDELETMLAHEHLNATCPILFFANKMDRPQSVSPVDCVQTLELDKIQEKPWHIAASNALSGEGLEEGIAWLGQAMGRKAGSRRG